MTFNDNANIDTSSVSAGGGGGGGGGGMMPGGIAVGGVGGLILMILMVLFGGNLTGGGGGGTGTSTDPTGGQVGTGGTDSSLQQQLDSCTKGSQANTNDVCLVKATVDSVEKYWSTELNKYGQTYTPAMTKVYSGSMQSGCGTASEAMGPFYCPTDKQVYIDAGFFQELQSKYGSDGGQLAKEYVLAHEYGHHVQDLLNLLGKAQQDPQGAESGSVRTELQADCFAGMWAHDASTTKDASGTPLLKPMTQADINSALSAAAAVGDDRIQQKAQGRVTPESWTHGSSKARQYWFTAGYNAGNDINKCDTFNASDLHE